MSCQPLILNCLAEQKRHVTKKKLTLHAKKYQLIWNKVPLCL